MQFKWATILSLAVGSVTALKQNELCGDSVDCTANCAEGRYHNVVTADSTFFGCKLDDTTQYVVAMCSNTKGNDITERQCYGGRYCSKGCVLTTSAESSFMESCTQSNGNPIEGTAATSYEKAVEAAGCDA